MYGNRSTEICQSRYSIYLRSNMAMDITTADDGARRYTFHAPQTFRIDPKYRTSAVFVRSFHAYSPLRNQDWISDAAGVGLDTPAVVLRLHSSPLRNCRVADERNIGMGSVLGVVPTSLVEHTAAAINNATIVGKFFDGDVATHGHFVGTTFVNDEIVLSVSPITKASDGDYPYDLPNKFEWFMQLEVQMLCNEPEDAMSMN